MLQVPSLPNYVAQVPYTQQPSYNAVKIDIINPTAGGGATCPIQQQHPQYAPVTAPYYNYPQAQLYDYPQAVQQPYYTMPQQPVNINTSASAQTAYQPVPYPVAPQQPVNVNTSASAQTAYQPVPYPVAPQQPVNVNTSASAQTAYRPVVCPAPQVTTSASANASVGQPPQQVNINQAPQAAPIVTAAPQAEQQPAVEVVPPVSVAPQVDLNGFIARLNNPDFEIQANAMEEIANMVKDEPQKATELLDAKIIDILTNIMNVDSSNLAGPTQEQISAREKLMTGQQISEQEKALATTITPGEQAERNKSYAMFTVAILEKLYGDEVTKLTGTKVPLTELPAAMSIVDQLKDNPNPMVRTSAIEALSYIQAPEYKKDLTTLFSIAKNDQDQGVREAASTALDKLNQV